MSHRTRKFSQKSVAPSNIFCNSHQSYCIRKSNGIILFFFCLPGNIISFLSTNMKFQRFFYETKFSIAYMHCDPRLCKISEHARAFSWKKVTRADGKVSSKNIMITIIFMIKKKNERNIFNYKISFVPMKLFQN